ncbi:hypothetical protein G8J22_02331 [Lentilactobacillus hilgardii]|nr:hypothetical protein HMPREF0497_1679 [Lentilactobacillus buchneri ATCC 11577]QIR10323.1 hypothetical protein G8J22_02331 [Lentilactobacillus hilgardii]
MTGNDEKRSLVVKREQFITSLKERDELLYLKKYRATNNLSQDDLAKKLFVSRQAISKWE